MSSCVCLNHSDIYKNYFILQYKIKIKIFRELPTTFICTSCKNTKFWEIHTACFWKCNIQYLTGIRSLLYMYVFVITQKQSHRVLYVLKFAFIFKVLTHIIKCFIDQDLISILVWITLEPPFLGFLVRQTVLPLNWMKSGLLQW